MGNVVDRMGNKYGELTVIKYAGIGSRGNALWVCACSCGNETTVGSNNLRPSGVKTCGIGIHARNYRHGQATNGMSLEYKAWAHMLDRSRNPNNKSAHRYSLRGITCCTRWYTFVNFLADMGPKPSVQHSIERRDNDKGYAPSNCYWATATEQNRNSSNAKLTMQKAKDIRAAKLNGVSVKQLCQKYGTGPTAIYYVLQNKTWVEQ